MKQEWMTCPRCGGKGVTPTTAAAVFRPCGTCDGSGIVVIVRR